jgi:hypothetical protein
VAPSAELAIRDPQLTLTSLSDRCGLAILLDLWRVPVDGAAPLQITHDRGFDAVEPPGRDFIIFTKQRMPGFWSATADGSGEHIIPELAGIDAHRYWTVSHEGIYFASGDKPPHRVCFFDFDTRKIREVARIPGKLVLDTPSLDISPDGRYLLYGQVGGVSADLILVDHW